MYHVYILRSRSHPHETYIVSTHDLRARLAQHDAGKSIHSNKFSSWTLLSSFAVHERSMAEKFDEYLENRIGALVRFAPFLSTNHLQQIEQALFSYASVALNNYAEQAFCGDNRSNHFLKPN